jgi:hypothetical protein
MPFTAKAANMECCLECSTAMQQRHLQRNLSGEPTEDCSSEGHPNRQVKQASMHALRTLHSVVESQSVARPAACSAWSHEGRRSQGRKHPKGRTHALRLHVPGTGASSCSGRIGRQQVLGPCVICKEAHMASAVGPPRRSEASSSLGWGG